MLGEADGYFSTDGRASLETLRYFWGDFYQLDCEDGRYVARPLRWEGEPLASDDSEELLTAMRAEFVSKTQGGTA